MSGGERDKPTPPDDGSTIEFIAMRSVREPAPEAAFAFTADALAGVELRVVAADVHEGLNELYEAAVELCTSDPALDVHALLGARAALEIKRGQRKRRVCGVVRRVERMDSAGGRRRVKVALVPALWALSQRTDSRTFQDRSALEIVKDVLDAAGLDPEGLDSKVTREYLKREYCVQYRETDLAFVMRLLEEEGVTFYFRHDGAAEVLVLSDTTSFPLCPTLDRRAVPFSPPQSELAHVEVVQRFGLARELRPTGFTARDHDFTRPSAELDLTRAHPRGDQGPRARYDYPARFTLADYDDGSHTYTTHDGARRAETRHHEESATESLGEGAGNVTGFMPGRVFELVGHEHDDLDRRYLLTRVRHHLRAPEELHAEGHERGASAGTDRYRNEFVCVPEDVPWVPPRRTPRPTILAAQTATVTGPAGEEIYVDHHARIKVQFHWDRLGRRDEKSSCWVRTSQSWAGAGWGAQFIPRVGMEVVVTFLEGDPDRPLVTGCVYNGASATPYPLPAEKTRSTIKSNSSPGGNGYNELRFEDLAGREEVFLHAQRDLHEVVENDRNTVIHHDESAVVDGDRTRTVAGNEAVTVAKDRVVHVKGRYATVVDGNGDGGGDRDVAALAEQLKAISPQAPAASTGAAPSAAGVTPPAADLNAALQGVVALAGSPEAVDALAKVFSSPEAAEAVGALMRDPRVSAALVAAVKGEGDLGQALADLAAAGAETVIPAAVKALGGPSSAALTLRGIDAAKRALGVMGTAPAAPEGASPDHGGGVLQGGGGGDVQDAVRRIFYTVETPVGSIKAGVGFTIEAGLALKLSVGGSSITLTPGEIVITSPMVKINC